MSEQDESWTLEDYLKSDPDVWAPPPAKSGGPPVFVRDTPIPWEPAIRIPDEGTFERLGQEAYKKHLERERLISETLGEPAVDMTWLERLAAAKLLGHDGDVSEEERQPPPKVETPALDLDALAEEGIFAPEVKDVSRTTRGRQYKRPKPTDVDERLIAYLERETGLDINDMRAAYSLGRGRLPAWATEVRSKIGPVLAQIVPKGEVPFIVSHTLGAAPRTLKRDIARAGGALETALPKGEQKNFGRLDLHMWRNGLEPRTRKAQKLPWEAAKRDG